MSDPGPDLPASAPGTSDLAARLGSVRERVGEACLRAGRDPAEVTTIVVTKFHPASMVRALYDLGVRDVAENRHQEALAKWRSVGALPGLAWHFVGQLQSNKARQVTEYATTVHSVDRDSVVEALARSEREVGCFVQINLTSDPARGGVAPSEAERLAERVLTHPGLTLLGVMAVAPLGSDPRPAFARLREVSERVRRLAPDADRISAGMSQDFADAIAEGATHLRIGTAITGNRPQSG